MNKKDERDFLLMTIRDSLEAAPIGALRMIWGVLRGYAARRDNAAGRQ